MKKTKFVTSFFANHVKSPFWGNNGREDRYLYSIKTLCNMGESLICYTDLGDLGYDTLSAFKEKNKLNNLIIKPYSLIDNPYQERVFNIRKNNPEVYDNPGSGTYSRPFQIYWLKFDFLLKEWEPDINLYWIDAGLACEGMFPPRLSPYGDEENYRNFYRGTYEGNEHKMFTFTKAFDNTTPQRIAEFTEDKLVFLSRGGTTDCDHNEFSRVIQDKLNYLQECSKTGYPVGGFFGGNSNHIPILVETAKRCIELVLQDNFYLCSDQEILTYFLIKFPDLTKSWIFDTFFHEGYPDLWDESKISLFKFFAD